MKKFLSLFMATLMIFAVIGAVPAVSAEEIQYESVDEDFIKEHWERYWGADEVVKVGDWYYKFTNTYYGDRYLSGVCGYDGDETEITIPTELGGEEVKAIEKFYLFSPTVKTINIPKGIRFKDVYHGYEYMRFGPLTNLEEIVVEEGGSYWTVDGVLFSGNELCIYPPAKEGSEYVIPSFVYRIATGAFYEPDYLRSLTIPQNVSIINEDAITPMLENLYFYTLEDLYSNLREEHWSSEFGYSYVEMPRVPNGTIYCIEGSELHSYYSKDAKSHYNNLVVLKDELVKKEDGKWYHFRGGIIDVTKEFGYIGNNLVKYKDKWFYTEKGIWTKKTRLFEYEGKWFYIKDGKWDKTKTDLVWYKNKWFYVEEGKWDSGIDTLIKKNGKWFAVKSGKWYKDKAIIKYSGKKFYVNKGFVQFDYSGKVKVDGETYRIKNGKVV